MVQSYTISNDDDTFRLSALVEDGKYYWPYLVFMNDGIEVDMWDNEDYLFKELYPYLNGVVNRDFSFSEEEIKDLLEMFNTAIDLGFFNHSENE